jgi:hypothetical protein
MTFERLIGDIRAEVNEETRLAILDDETIISWIADAIQEISESLIIEGEFDITLSGGVKDYAVRSFVDHEIRRITSATTSFSGFTRVLTVESIDSVAYFRERDEELIRAFTNWNAPNHLVLWRDNDGASVLRFYPTPLEQDISNPMVVNITYRKLLISDEVRENFTFTDEIPLPLQYQRIIKYYAIAQVYLWLKERQNFRESMHLFDGSIRDLKRNRAFSKRKRIEGDQ